MTLHRRQFMSAGATAITAAAAGRALGAPLLSARPELTLDQARRRNAWLEIDTGQFLRNLAGVRAILGPVPPELCVVVKADAYGAGMSLITPALIQAGVRVIGVCTNDEARVARDLGFRGRIIRLRTALADEVEDAWRLNMEELLGNAAEAELIAQRRARAAPDRPLPFHLGVDAGGMSRNGLDLDLADARADALSILRRPQLRPVGAMTHYPMETQDDVLAQLGRFKAGVAWLRANGLPQTGVTLHTANSSCSSRFPETRLDMVRVGSFIFGDTEPDYPQFLGVITLKTRVAAINHYPAGSTVNYDRTYRLDRDSWLANLPIGYSDGYRRTLTHANQPEFSAEGRNHSQVLIGGRRFPVVGRVTMNTMMVDVTGHQDRIGLGDEVVLWGAQGAERITKEEVEINAGAYGADLYTMIGNSVPKVLARG